MLLLLKKKKKGKARALCVFACTFSPISIEFIFDLLEEESAQLIPGKSAEIPSWSPVAAHFHLPAGAGQVLLLLLESAATYNFMFFWYSLL